MASTSDVSLDNYQTAREQTAVAASPNHRRETRISVGIFES